jgi:hypothetical protein
VVIVTIQTNQSLLTWRIRRPFFYRILLRNFVHKVIIINILVSGFDVALVGFVLEINFVRPLAIVLALLFGWGIGPVALADDAVAVSIQNDPDFADLQIQLQLLVNTMGFHAMNHFCVVGYEAKGNTDVLPYIYWPTQNKLIVWDDNIILESAHYSDLTRDILPDGAMTINRLHRSDVNDIIQDCRKYGDVYTIKKTANGWVPIGHFRQFATIKAQLQDLADHDATQKINRFCVIGQKDGAFLGAYVYWLTGDQLIFWLPDPQDIYDLDALTNSAVKIDLKHGLRNEEDSADDENEMQRSYAEVILKACQKLEQNFVINKSN